MKMNDSESLKLKEQFEKVCESRFNVWFLNSIDPLLFGKAVRVMPLKKNSKVIELGCGTGWASRRMAKIAAHGEVVGIDLLESMIETAKQFTAKDKSRNYENLSFMVADAESIPYPDNYFDYAISITSFSWWRNPDRGLEEIEREKEKSSILTNFFYTEYLVFNLLALACILNTINEYLIFCAVYGWIFLIVVFTKLTKKAYHLKRGW